MIQSIKMASKKLKPIGRLFVPNVKTIVLLYVLILLLVLRIGMDNFLIKHIGSNLTDFHSLLSNNRLINWATTISLAIVSVVLVKQHYDKNRQYGWTIVISIFFILYLLIDDFWMWALTPFGISYKTLLIIILLAFFSCGCLHLWQLIKNSPRAANDEEEKAIGFAVTTTKESLQETGWQSYVENLVSKMLVTELSNESFAIGISGVWGSGKTTFLKATEQALHRKVYLLTFNPWNGESASQITNDFFETLVSGLSVSSSQRKSINRYARLLSQVDILKPHAKILETILEGIRPSITDAKEQVEKVIASMPLPVVVVIDDLDRLEGTELMAVLKLIRITANFKNLIFIVAYDKGYISNALKGVGGEEFLKKVFPLEICLPDYEPNIRELHLYSELKTGLANESILKELEYDIFHGALDHKVSFYLPTFRDVKRFANLFCLNINSFVRAGTLSEINVRDFFFVELLHYYDVKAYEYLKTLPSALIPRTLNLKGKPVYSYMSPGTIKGVKSYEEADKKKKEILEQYGEGFSDILWTLFGSTAIDENNQIRYPVNVSKYFSFRITNNQISLSEFEDFISITDTAVIDSKVKEYCRGGTPKYNSLYYHLISQSLDPQNKQQAFNIIYSLIELWKYSRFAIDAIGKTLLDKKAFKASGTVPEAFKEAVKAQIGTKPAYIANGIQMLLTALVEYGLIDHCDEAGVHVEYSSIIGEDILRELTAANFMSVLGDRSMPIQDLTDKNSHFHQFVKLAVAKVGLEYNNDQETIDYKRSLLVGKLKEIYAGKDNSAGLEAFFNNLDPRPKSDEENDYPEEAFDEGVSFNISQVFGNDWSFRDFKAFVKAAFAGQIDEVNACLRRLNRDPIDE